MVQDAISKAENIIHWTDSKATQLQISSEPRASISGACFDLAYEHRTSIVFLIKNNLTGSALSLLRPMFEVFIRGIWFQEKASDDEISKFTTKDVLDKKFDELVRDVETTEAYNPDYLNKGGTSLGNFKKAVWPIMNSYVHSGYRQITRRITHDSITPNYSDEEKVEAIRCAYSIGALAFSAMAHLANNMEIQEKFLVLAEEWFSTP